MSTTPARGLVEPLVLLRLIVRFRRPLIVLFQLALMVLSSYLAFWLRFDGEVPEADLQRFARTLPWLLTIRGLVFAVLRLYEGLWRYTGIWDLSRIIAGVSVSSVMFWIVVRWGLGMINYPRSIFIIDAVLLVVMLGGARLGRRIRHEFTRQHRGRRVLIAGAGDAGEMLVRDMLKQSQSGYQPVGFIDDDPRKNGERIHGVRVLGGRADLPRIIARVQPEEVVVAIPSLGPAAMRELVTALEPFKIRIATLPTLRDIVDGRVSVAQVRNLSIEDLLPRAPVGLDPHALQHLVRGKRVLVTGAGGSIGGELCRQLVKLQPEGLILYERHENSLYTITSELEDAGHCSIVHPMIGDVTDRDGLDRTFALHRPALVFHAAAHKHVPLMELHVCEAVKNNVVGTRMVVEASIRHGVERFILISTDKAVEPSSIMGATKRIAELAVQAASQDRGTRLSIVRFGNVLGSNGSVLPRFLAQVRAGGPITVTHPEMRRYFMLIPEAVQLVLHAAALQDGRHPIYVLDMGDQLNLSDMARKVIRLSGYVPDKDIAITYVGLRPGEKLSERLVGDDEIVEISGEDKILRVRPAAPPEPALVLQQLADLELAAARQQTGTVLRLLRQLVPSFAPPLAVVGAGIGAGQAATVVPAHAEWVRAQSRSPDYVDRRVGPADRRDQRRGGRRLSDRVRLAMVRTTLPQVPREISARPARRQTAGR